jgi:Leucine-rich repeat (LRR) protein
MNNMKKIYLLLVLLMSSIAMSYSAKADVILNATNFPDANFRAKVATLTGVAEGGTITDSLISATTAINCRNSNIADLTGIEHFTALTSLNCELNQLTSIDVSHNTALKSLNVSANNLTGLNVTANTALDSLSCYNNQLTALNVTQNTSLVSLNCKFNQLTALDVTLNTALTYLNCSINQLPSLNVTLNTALRTLDCSNNSHISALDVTHNTALVTLSCSNDSLTALDVTLNTALETLNCGNNKLHSLDVTHNGALKNLTCFSNSITTLNLSQNPYLIQLYCNNNPMPVLDVTHNTHLSDFNCGNIGVSTLDLSHNTELLKLDCQINNLKKLDLAANTSLSALYCGSNMLTTLDLSHNTTLQTLTCINNMLAAIDLSHNTALTAFNAKNNGRKIKVYTYLRSEANGGGLGYYVPLEDQNDTIKSVAALIDSAGQSGDTAFDLSKAVGGSWTGCTTGTLDGVTVLYLDASLKKITYNYNTSFTGSAPMWTTDNSATSPNTNFFLTWDTKGIITGVDGVESSDVNVYTTAGMINIGGSFNGKVNVYNLRGQQVYCGNSSEIEVPAGMYIVKVDGTVHKVLVK